MLLLEKRRKGRELDSLARKYSDVVIRMLTKSDNIERLKNGETIDDYIELRPLGLARPNLIGIELEINSNLENNAIATGGGFEWIPGEPELSYIRVEASIPKPFTKKHLARFYRELIEIMRHEIEHSTQDINRLEQIASDASETFNPFGSKEELLQYFTSPEEIAGHVTGWMKLAKHTKQPLKDVIKKQIGYIKSYAESEGIPKNDLEAATNQMLQKFIQYAKNRYER